MGFFSGNNGLQPSDFASWSTSPAKQKAIKSQKADERKAKQRAANERARAQRARKRKQAKRDQARKKGNTWGSAKPAKRRSGWFA